ncbi:hypothetical protein Dda_1103 [Drechslerella dactyloides]|uniref:Uncharacterized protein n=1 Tax=Drechslerella dactyloides TaxID=74499 RepID=A0AAD6J637_DREDA|nr:hypothetical protein Dda_1103 [Drechslerella dactyloides]
MKVTATALVLIAQFTGVFSAAVSAAAAECGALGVFDTSSLPIGVDASISRKCAGHPMGRDRDLEHASLAPMDEVAIKRSQDDADLTPVSVRSVLSGQSAQKCDHSAPYGCSRGYCWKSCGAKGSGQWCWTAGGVGNGDWIKCKSYTECGTTTYACGWGCIGKNAGQCGCSC